jgi:hypothetical protein
MLFLVSSLVLCLGANPARSTENRRPFELHMVGKLRPAIVGEVYQATVEIEALEPVVLSNLGLSSTAWTILSFNAPSSAVLVPGQRIQFDFEAIPSDTDWPLMLDYIADNDADSYPMDLSPRAVERVTTQGLSVTIPRGSQTPSKQSLEPQAPPPRIFPEGTEAARDIRVEGIIQYLRPGDLQMNGADNARIRVYHQRDCEFWDCPDELLAEDYTNSAGAFDTTFFWDHGGFDPDLYVEYACRNPNVIIKPYNWVEEGSLYLWKSATLENFAGDYYDFQGLAPADPADYAALHMLTTFSRAWRWLDDKGYGPDLVSVRWPETGSTNAYWSNRVISIPPGTKPGDADYVNNQRWSEGTLLHEYGHHWLHEFGSVNSARDYCNGVCDQPGKCRHCNWCEETEWDAWNEGFSDWFGDVIPRSFITDYPPGPWSRLKRESQQPAIEGGAGWSPANPNAGAPCDSSRWLMEGPVSALLRDIEDPGSDDDPLIPGTWTDVLNEPAQEVLRIASTPFGPGPNEPESISEFLDAFAEDRPDIKEEIWETAKNNGYETDVDPPFIVTNITSSHDWTKFGAESADATIDFNWTRPNDDASGIDGYAVSLSLGGIEDPGFAANLGDVTTVTTTPRPPDGGLGYWFNIRAKDRAGNWNASAVHDGPYHIRSADPTDLVPYLFAGWADRIVPRDKTNASGASCPAPDTLWGNQALTYWNLSGKNEGDDPTSGAFESYVFVDGNYRISAVFPGADGNQTFFTVNEGPLFVTGGRHTFSLLHDGMEEIAEGSESNNIWGRQWIWTPQLLSPGVQVTRAAPPTKDGGWETILDGATKWYNSDGLRFNSASGDWHAVWVHAAKDANNYDCRLHVASTGAGDGFAGNMGYSQAPAGGLDAVLLNRTNTGGSSDWDVGVIEEERVTNIALGDYRAKHVVDETIAFGSVVAVTMPENEMLLLREFRVLPGQVGPVSITVLVDPAEGPFHVLWLADDFTTGTILNGYDAYAVTDTTGKAQLDFFVDVPGFNCLVIYRDPANFGSPGILATSKAGAVPSSTFGTTAAAVDLTVEVRTTPPDFKPFEAAAGWYAPLVPRPAPDGTPGGVPPPSVLVGDAASTYLNIAVQNDSPTASGAGMISRVSLDGAQSWEEVWSAFPAGSYQFVNSDTARMVRGGRHSLSLLLDTVDAFYERDEANNVFGEQWAWAPPEIPTGVGITRAIPPDPTGGWVEVTMREPIYYNCDGIRTPVFSASGPDGYWGGVAAVPGVSSDVDLRLHDKEDDAKTGFGSYLKISAWGVGLSEYVLANFNHLPFQAFDVGVLRNGGSEDYVAELVSSVFRGGGTTGSDTVDVTVGPVTMGSDRILDLHEFYLQPGTYRFWLENLSGSVDWGITLHDAGVVHHAKSSAYGSAYGPAIAWLNGAGVDEEFLVQLEEEGYYCAGVWKARSADLPQLGIYQLHVTDSPPVDVPPGSQTVSIAWLWPPHPNPSVGNTSVRFRLPDEREVLVEIFNIKGARVRTLTQGLRQAGEHRLVWDGNDDAGRVVPTGVYQLRVSAGEFQATRKLVRLR